MLKKANISECGKYRYSLERHWGSGDRIVAFIGLNPSVADAKIDDPTIRRCINFAKSWGYDGLIMLNLFAYRSTNPKNLLDKETHYIFGPENEATLRQLLPKVDAVICAWGSHKTVGSLTPKLLLKQFGAEHFKCLGLTKSGAPRHPLYVKGDTTPIDF